MLERRRFQRGDFDGVEGALRLGLERFPDELVLLLQLAHLLQDRKRGRESEAVFRRVLELRPHDPDARSALAAIDATMGRLDENLAILRAIEREGPLLFTETILGLMLYSAKTTDDELFEEQLKRGRKVEAKALRLSPPPRASRPPRLKIGYVSADFRDHSVARFIEPALRHHDRQRFEIHAYHTRAGGDASTARLAELADVFHDVAALDDLPLARRILDDSIDVLVDLGGHTEHSRIEAFAHRPAPVQVSYLGYAAFRKMKPAFADVL